MQQANPKKRKRFIVSDKVHVSSLRNRSVISKSNKSAHHTSK